MPAELEISHRKQSKAKRREQRQAQRHCAQAPRLWIAGFPQPRGRGVRQAKAAQPLSGIRPAYSVRPVLATWNRTKLARQPVAQHLHMRAAIGARKTWSVRVIGHKLSTGNMRIADDRSATNADSTSKRQRTQRRCSMLHKTPTAAKFCGKRRVNVPRHRNPSEQSPVNRHHGFIQCARSQQHETASRPHKRNVRQKTAR